MIKKGLKEMSNIIIMNLSKLNGNVQSSVYSSDLGEIEGKYTADAPIKYLMMYFAKNKKQADKILTVITKEAEDALPEFKDMLEEYCKENGYAVPEIIPINGKEEIITITEVAEKVEEKDSIFIETTGGLRNTTYTLMTIVRMLEFSGVVLEKAVYSNYIGKRIEDITNTYKMFNLINAANSFTSYGSSKELNAIFKNSKDENILKAISAMNTFSDEIALCRTKKLKSSLKNLNKNLRSLMSNNAKTKEAEMFKTLVNVIRRKFYITDGKSEIEIPNVVKWCIDNNLIQQGVTIYTELMPQYFREKFYTASEKQISIASSKKEYDLDYKLFCEGFMECIPEGRKNKKTYGEKVLDTIEYLDEALINNDEYKLSENCSIEKMQIIMRDYLYIKKYIRNKLNHASEKEETVINRISDYLSGYGYNTSEQLSIDEIIKIIRKALSNIKC